MKILILEDDPERVKHFKKQLYEHELFITHLTTHAIEWIRSIDFDIILLDHDLSQDVQGLDNNFAEGTGLEVALVIGNNPEYSPNAQVIVHSLNVGGAQRMISAMESRGEVPHVPFLWLKEVTFN